METKSQMSQASELGGHPPTFVHIGGQRCGTTWMYRCLSEHPEVFTSDPKELHYFDDGNFEKGEQWYRQHFQPEQQHNAWGEVTPRYLSWRTEGDDSVPGRMAQVAPDSRIICCLRNPLDRAYSQWKTFLRGDSGPSFEEAVAGDIGDCLQRGLYARHLKRWLRHFDREQILVQIHGNVLQDNAGAVREVYEHIGVDPTFVPSSVGKAQNALILPDVQKTLRRLGFNWAIQAARTSPVGTWIRRVHQWRKSKSGADYDEMSDKARQRLHDHFAEPNQELESLLGITLDEWPT